MHFKTELSSYLAALRSRFRAFFTVAFCIEDLFLLLNKNLFISILAPFLTPI